MTDGPELFDCHSCGSARSVEHGLCQVCLTEYREDTQVIPLPKAARDRRRAVHPQPPPPDLGIAE